MRCLEYFCACALAAFVALSLSGLATIFIFLSPVIIY